MAFLASFMRILRRVRSSDQGVLVLLAERLSPRLAHFCLRPLLRDTRKDPCHLVFQRFLDEVNGAPGSSVLEIGSRARSGNIYTEFLSKSVKYSGMDIIPGPNVDWVGDAHELSTCTGGETFDAIFSISVFEHLGMPWKVVLEMNKIMRTGGIVFVATHQTWSLHDRPWDFFRFSADAFRTLFNRTTGFEIVEVREGLPCRIFPLGSEASMKGMEFNREAYLLTTMIARKIGDSDPRLRWDVTLS